MPVGLWVELLRSAVDFVDVDTRRTRRGPSRPAEPQALQAHLHAHMHTHTHDLWAAPPLHRPKRFRTIPRFERPLTDASRSFNRSMQSKRFDGVARPPWCGAVAKQSIKDATRHSAWRPKASPPLLRIQKRAHIYGPYMMAHLGRLLMTRDDSSSEASTRVGLLACMHPLASIGRRQSAERWMD